MKTGDSRINYSNGDNGLRRALKAIVQVVAHPAMGGARSKRAIPDFIFFRVIFWLYNDQKGQDFLFLKGVRIMANNETINIKVVGEEGKQETIFDKAKQKVKEAKEKTKNGVRYIIEHPIETAIVVSTATTITKKVVIPVMNHRAEVKRELEVYDNTIGRYWTLRKKPSARQAAEINSILERKKDDRDETGYLSEYLKRERLI